MDKDQPPLFAEGGCLCGAVRYRISGTPVSSSVCRCRSCRPASGAPGVVHKDHYQLLQGHPPRTTRRARSGSSTALRGKL